MKLLVALVYLALPCALLAQMRLDPRSAPKATPQATPAVPAVVPSTAPSAAQSPTQLPEIRDIVPPVDVFPYPPWMVATAAGLVLIVLGLLVWLLVRWLSNRPVPPPPTPRQIALQALESLRARESSMAPYVFSIEVSDVLRQFVSAHFGLSATRQTSPEFLASLSLAPQFSEDDRSLLAHFLEKCDLIKFARLEASHADSEQLLTSAIAFVQGGQP